MDSLYRNAYIGVFRLSPIKSDIHFFGWYRTDFRYQYRIIPNGQCATFAFVWWTTLVHDVSSDKLQISKQPNKLIQYVIWTSYFRLVCQSQMQHVISLQTLSSSGWPLSSIVGTSPLLIPLTCCQLNVFIQSQCWGRAEWVLSRHEDILISEYLEWQALHSVHFLGTPN